MPNLIEVKILVLVKNLIFSKIEEVNNILNYKIRVNKDNFFFNNI